MQVFWNCRVHSYMYFDQYFRKLVVCLCARVSAHFVFTLSGL